MAFRIGSKKKSNTEVAFCNKKILGVGSKSDLQKPDNVSPTLTKPKEKF